MDPFHSSHYCDRYITVHYCTNIKLTVPGVSVLVAWYTKNTEMKQTQNYCCYDKNVFT